MSRQAPFLHALADHIVRHGLPPVNIHSDHAGGWSLQLVADVPAGLVAWARSLDTVRFDVHTQPRLVSVEFCSQLGGRALQVWGSVEGLTGTGPTVSVADLAYFAVHGEVPPGGAS